MTVFVAGATGAIGMPLVRQLVAAEHVVYALTRRPEYAVWLKAAGAIPVIADVLDEPGLLTAVDGLSADAVVHECTSIARIPLSPKGLRPTNRLRIQGSAHLIGAARRLGARRYVTQSFFGGYGYTDHGDTPLTEQAPFAEAAGRATDEIMDALSSAEGQAFEARGMEGIALRYGSFYGPGSVRMLERMLRNRLLVLPKDARGVWPFIHVDDAASATVDALERGKPGQAYNVADDRPVPFVEFLIELSRAVDAPLPIEVPDWLLFPFPFMREMLSSTIRLDTTKARTELGWTPAYPTCREGLAAVAQALGHHPDHGANGDKPDLKRVSALLSRVF